MQITCGVLASRLSKMPPDAEVRILLNGATGIEIRSNTEVFEHFIRPCQAHQPAFRHWATGALATPYFRLAGVERINRATSSGSSICTKCRAVGSRNKSDVVNNS